jgi:hypothetical protein
MKREQRVEERIHLVRTDCRVILSHPVILSAAKDLLFDPAKADPSVRSR